MTPNPQIRHPSRRRAAASPQRASSLPRTQARVDVARRSRAAVGLPDVRAPTHRLLSRLLVAALFVAAVAVLSLPAARTTSLLLGWMPLWLLGMPLTSVVALRVSRSRIDVAGLARRRQRCAKSSLTRSRE